MDPSIQKALHDKLYDRRKIGALDLEKLVRDCLATNEHDRIAKIVDQLCHDYAYAIHYPYARNGGLIGLAAASIALGPEVARYLEQIVPPVLACFSDQDARVRYYACESMYNIAKTSKGEILPYFNEMFDALAKLAADAEPSVKNGAELLDRLIKDIISESATSYVSVLHDYEDNESTAFSLARFMPLLQERIFVLNPFTRMFLVSWITLLDSIPDLELVSYLSSFLSGLFRFLNDSNQDVVTATQHVLERFLEEIKLVADVKRGLQSGLHEDERGRRLHRGKSENPLDTGGGGETSLQEQNLSFQEQIDRQENQENAENASTSGSESATHEDWIPGQDVHLDYPKILEILVTFLHDTSDHVLLTALRWIDSFFDICPEDILPFVPALLNRVLPALSSSIEQVRVAGARVNSSLMEYIETSVDAEGRRETEESTPHGRDTPTTLKSGKTLSKDDIAISSTPTPSPSPSPSPSHSPGGSSSTSLNYEAAVNALTTQFLNENEVTRAAALLWLIMLQRKAPKKVLAAHDGTFPTLLQTLSDPSDTVVIRDLQLLSQISKHSDDSYFSFFMVNLLKLFARDRKLLETRGNLIIRQICTSLSPERIYRTMAGCLEKQEDAEFASIMVQNLNNNLTTAPELADLRKRLRSWELRDGQTLFVTLFRAWCHNAVATISLCLLAQAYEQAYSLLQIFADIEMTVAMLIQIDKLVQLLESPVFTFLRLQLLEPAQYPHLYKTLYGILMLLPQSAAFAALKNRLNSVSAIGYLHIPQQPSSHLYSSASAVASRANSVTAQTIVPPLFERSGGRQKSKDDGVVKWSELLERFKSTQDRARRTSHGRWSDENGGEPGPEMPLLEGPGGPGQSATQRKLLSAGTIPAQLGRPGEQAGGSSKQAQQPVNVPDKAVKERKVFGATQLGRLASGVRGKSKK